MKYYIFRFIWRLRFFFVIDFICILLQVLEEIGYKRSIRVIIDVTVSGINDFDFVVISFSGNFIGIISEDVDVGILLRV